MSQQDAIAAAIAAAQNAAAAVVAGQAAVPATAPAAGPAGVPARTTPVTIDDLMLGSMQVDEWLKVKEHGLLIGNNTTLIQAPIKVTIDMKAIHPNYSIKWGNPAQYEKTYDRVTTAKGRSWAETVRQIQQMDPKAYEYRSCDVPMTLVEDVVVNGKVICEKGKRLGNSLSTTNWSNFEDFYRNVKAQNLTEAVVVVEVGYQRKTNSKGNAWGVLTFKLISPLQ